MKLISASIFFIALSIQIGCLGPDCPESPIKTRSNSEIDLRLVSSIDSITIIYETQIVNPENIIVREKRFEGLGDTVIFRFFGREQYYDHSLLHSVIVEKDGIRIKQIPSESTGVQYIESAGQIEVLKKKACSPIDARFFADSIHIDLGTIKKVVVQNI